jgi:hypothetical protein
MNSFSLRKLAASVLIVTFALHLATAHAADTLVPANALWKYADTTGDLGSAWIAPDFNDSSWPAGPAQLGFGDGDEATVIGANGARPPTVYFRTRFSVPDLLAVTSLNLRLIFDDGAVVYLNGVEVFRVNMPPGAVTWSTLAVSTADNTAAEGVIPSSMLAPGDNVLAVEVHQVNVSSSDLSFALELSANSLPPPELTRLSLAVLDGTASESGSGGALDQARFVVYRQGNLASGIPVQFSLGGTASNGVDYVAITNIFIPAGATQAVVTVSPRVDSVVEGSESVVLTIVPPVCPAIAPTPPECYMVDGLSTATVQILDSAAERTVLRLTATDADASEPGLTTLVNTGTFTIHRTGNLGSGIPVGLSFRGTAGNGTDYLFLSNSIYIPAGATQAMVHVVPLFDNLVEGLESVILSLVPPMCVAVDPAPPECYLVAGTNVVTVLIRDFPPDTGNQPPMVEIVAPTNNSFFAAPANIPIIANASDADGYETIQGVEFYAGTNKIGFKTNSLEINNSQPFTLIWENVPAGIYKLTAVAIDSSGGRGTSAPVQVTVRGDQVDTIVSLRVVDSDASEPGVTAEVNAATFAIRRQNNLDWAIPVHILLSGTASNGIDYRYISNSVVIPAGSTQALVHVAALMDNLVEPTESVTLTIPGIQCLVWSPQCYQLEGQASSLSGTVFIRDNSRVTNNLPPTVAVVAPSNNSTYPAPANIEIVANANDPDGYMTVRGVEFYANTTFLGFRTNDPVLNPLGPFVVYWTNVPAGVYDLRAVAIDAAFARGTSAPVRVIVGERPDGVIVAANAVWRYSATGTDLGTVWKNTDYDDSTWPSGPAELGYGDMDEATVIGGDLRPQTAYFRHSFSLREVPDGDVRLWLKYDDGAVVYLNGVEVFRVNLPAGPVTFDTLATIVAENNVVETTFPAWMLGTNNVLAVEMHQVNVTSSDISFALDLRGNVPPPTNVWTHISLAVVDEEAVEPGLLTAINPGTFAIRRSGNLASAIPVRYTLSGTASNGVDYQFLSNSVVIPAGATQALVRVIPLMDNLVEGIESVTLTIPRVQCIDWDPICYQLPGNAESVSGTVNIRDNSGTTNNHPPTVAIVTPTNGTSYAAPANIFIIANANDPDGYQTLVGVDFYAGSLHLGFKTNLPTANPIGPFFISWTNVPAGIYELTAVATDIAGARATSAPVRVTVGPVPPEPTIVHVVVPDGTAVEGGPTAVINPGTFALRRKGNLGTAIPVHISLTGTAANGVDYRSISNVVTIGANSTQALVHVVAMLDGIDEGPETVILEITQLDCLVASPECYTVGSPSSGTVTILDGTGTNRAPIVQLVAPQNGATFPAGTNINLVAAALDVDGTVMRVDFRAGNTLVGYSTNRIGTNFFAMWSNAPAGSHVLLAIATDDRAGRATSAPVNITVIGTTPTNVAELHVVAIYSGNVNGTSSPNHETGDSAVTVNRPGQHVILVLSAYEPTRWHVSVTDGTIIDSVLLLGYYDQSVDGLPPGTEVIELTAESNSSQYFYFSTSMDTPGFLRNVQRLCSTYGRGLSSFHGASVAPYPTPFEVNGIQSDPRLTCDYPQPVDPPELPELRFSMSFNDGSSSSVIVQEYGKDGPLITTAKLLPFYRVVRDASGMYYGAEQHHIWKVDPQANTVHDLQIPPSLPEMSWPMGTAYDSTRERVAVVTLGGEGYLYGYAPDSAQWSLISSMNNRDLDSLVYHAANDSYYGVTVGFGDYGSPRLLRFSASGELLGEMELPQQPYSIGFSGFRSELASVGNYLALILETDRYVPDNGKPEGRIYIIDPATQQAWLTYRRIGEGQNPPANQAPTVRITSPAEGATLPAGGSTRLSAVAHDSDGMVQTVEFYANNAAIGFGQRSNTSANIFVLDWTPPAPGPYTLKALATDGLGAQGWSIPVAIGVGTNIPPDTNVAFRLAFNDRNGTAGVFFRDYTLEGPVNGGRLLPTTRVVPDAYHNWYFGAEQQVAWKVSASSAAVTFIHEEIPADLPEFSWPIGVAYDGSRNRVLVGTLGGAGDLYAYTPPNGPWSHVASLDNHDYDCIVYHAANDSIYALEPIYGGAPRLVRLDADGNYVSEIQLPPQTPTLGQAAVSASELVSVGQHLVLLVEPPASWWPFGGESRIYLIDPRTGQVRLTYQRPVPPDSDRDGVPDSEDKCPNTPLYSQVDTNGCSLSQRDTDHDGVPDNMDQCPNTSAGVAVNEQGCPVEVDRDHDGVLDAVDACPNTPAGEVVNSSGCSINQLCPCEGRWPSRSDYFECVDAQTGLFATAGLITEEQRDRIRNAARDSECGKRNPILYPAEVINISTEGYRLRVENDGTPGRYILECSQDMSRWIPIQTNTTSQLRFEMLDANAKDGSPRFYRVKFEAAQ